MKTNTRRTLRWPSLRSLQLFDVRRHIAVILHLPHYGDATRSAVQCAPDFQQDARAVPFPMMIPESQFFDSLRSQKLLSLLVTSILLGQSVLKTVQFDRQLCDRTKEIEIVSASVMLPTELESGKTSRPQCTPEFLFLLRLLATELAGVGCGIHAGSVEG